MEQKLLRLVLVGLLMLNFQQSHAGIFKGDDKEKKEMEVSSESSFLQSNSEDGSFFYPGGSEELSDAPIGLPVDGSLMVALFLALLCVSYVFIKQRQVLFFRKYIIRYSTINITRIKNLALTLFVSLFLWGIGLPVIGQNLSVEGTWTLDNIEFFKKSDDSFKSIDQSEVSPSGMINRLYAVLWFDSNTCKAGIKKDQLNLFGRFKLEDNQLTLYFSPLADEFELTTEKNDKDSMILTKTYSEVDNTDNNRVSEYKITLTYKRK